MASRNLDNLSAYERIVASNPDHISLLDRNYTYRIVNNAYLLAHGRKRSEIVGRTVSELIGNSVFETLVRPNLDRSLAGEVIEYEAWFDFPEAGRCYMAVTYAPYYEDDRSIGGVVVTSRDITRQQRVHDTLQWEQDVNHALSRIYRPLISARSTIEQMAQSVLDQALRLTRSPHGFVSAIDPETGRNVGYTLTEMLKGQCRVSSAESCITFGLNDTGRYCGLIGHALNDRRAHYTNDPQNHPAATGTPAGHIPLTRFLSVPVLLQNEPVGQIALANKPDDYNDQDLAAVARLADYYALALQRTRFEQALKDGELRYHALFDGIQDAVFVHKLIDGQLPGKFTEVNRVACQRLGYSRQELLQLTPAAINSDTSQKQIPGLMQKLRDEKQIVFETRHRTKSGTELPVEVSSQIIQLEGSPAILSVARDIAERRKWQQALEAAHADLESRVEKRVREITALNTLSRQLSASLSLEQVAKAAVAGIVEPIGPDFAVLFLREGDDLLPLGVHKRNHVFADDFLPHRVGECLCGLAAQDRKPIYAIDIHQDHRCSWPECKEAGLLSFAALPLVSSNKLIGVLGLATLEQRRDFQLESAFLETLANEIATGLHNALLFDEVKQQGRELARSNERLRAQIAERQQAESNLRASEERFRLLFSRVFDALIMSDTHGRIVDVNERACKLLGYERPELLQRTMADLHPDHELAKFQAFAHRTLQEGVDYLGETLFISRDGRRIEVEAGGVCLSIDGRDFIVGSFRDVTDRKRLDAEKAGLESRLRQAQKMEAIGTLAGGIAHDFNNILGAIIGYSEMMELFEQPVQGELRNHLKEVLSAAYRAKDLVQQILTFSRQGDQEKQLIQIEPIVKEALKLLRASLPSTIQIRRKIDRLPGTIIGNATQIHQIVMNLCTNAAHAMRQDGGVLEIALSGCDSDSEHTQRYPELPAGPIARLTVQDNGIGIPPEAMDRIFEPYFTTKKKGEGTGLGLAVIHGIITNHSGTITVASEPGQGTCFEVLLPLRTTGDMLKQTPAEINTAPRGQGTILFVDDERALVDLSGRLLRSLGYTVRAYADSTEAFDYFKSQPTKVDLVITDQTMPKMTGIQLARKIKKIRADLPVILCTGYSETITPQSVKAAGIDEFIQKPVGTHQLARIIQSVLPVLPDPPE